MSMKQRFEALYLLMNHEHGPRIPKRDRDLVRSNCGACVLNGYGSEDGLPNHCNWMRIYVQARRTVTKRQRDAIMEAVAKGDVYGHALAEDIATHGLWIVEVTE